ncbi:conserved hypothetical protein [Tenacibaculum maritimum]|uniref:DUF4393 domain-containing protein n=1 Tax=Tenacibaculum maritimum TaxID=107401 RepID=UPI0012E54212|nr:DUF4393 domain-containing protein [Tenacibaculum maritimum]MCD9612089.1 DUF4393 domain-containing protein [Tenacibaculum maritimum]CAA0156056.1 conserved hypothetical protein [Tenacibaculum maritimum]CAA0208291.1 conserved hypothetical protein [Tenacibaculum maritimum]
MNPEDLKKIIPTEKIYDDALSPAMKQIGKALEGVAKTSRFLLAPFDYLAAQHSRWERYLEKVAAKVPEENLTEGHPQIVIPTLEGLSLSYENTLLSELFVSLLANSIDNRKQNLAHPAFPNIISQLSHDEAVILFYLKKKNWIVKQKSDLDNEAQRFINEETTYEEFPLDKLLYPENIWVYMNHLNSLNIAGTWQVENQSPIIEDATGKQIGVNIISERKLTEFGQLFVESCVPDDFNEI